MEAKLKELMSQVHRYLGCHEDLTALLEQEQAALISRNLELMTLLGRAKEEAAERIAKLLPQLTATIRETGRELGLPDAPTPTLAELAQVAPAPYATALELAGKKLARLRREVSRQNRTNRAFIQDALDFISGSIAILTGATVKPRTGYLRSGTHAPASGHQPVRLNREI